jgi:uncharacterized protein
MVAQTAVEPEAQVAPSPFENRFTSQFGMPSERVQKKVQDALNEDFKAFIRRSPFLVMATSDSAGRCDASPRGGKPGFVTILDDRHLLLPDVAGNRRFDSYLNVEQNPYVGLLFLIPGNDRTVRVNGRARAVAKEEVLQHIAGLSIHNPDEEAVLLQGLLVEVEEAFSHCPRSFRFADLWTPEAARTADG